MKDNPFALITAAGEKYPLATQVPLEIEELQDDKMILLGHLMKNTDYQLAFEKNKKVLVVFTGPNCFISSSWYGKPGIASTWNYMSVHAKGIITFSDEEGTYQAIKAISDKYEGKASSNSFDKLPKDYVQKMLKAVIAFNIEVESLEHVFKLSQNHEAETRRQIVAQLNLRTDEHSRAIAREMEKRLG